MPGHDFDAAIYVKSAPEFRFEDGMFHICHKVGAGGVEFVMRPSLFIKALRAANKAADEFHEADSAIPLKEKR